MTIALQDKLQADAFHDVSKSKRRTYFYCISSRKFSFRCGSWLQKGVLGAQFLSARSQSCVVLQAVGKIA